MGELEMIIEKVRGILWDFDGVIVDTIGDLSKSWKYVLSQQGVEIKESDYPPHEGRSQLEIARLLGQQYGKEFTSEECAKIKAAKDNYYLANFELRFFPLAPEIIDELSRKNIKQGIVTASTQKKMRGKTPQGFLDKFEAILTQDDTMRGKPFPDPYEAGLRKLDLPRENVMVIENAPLGIQSAKAAGIYTIGIATTLDREYLKAAGADKIVSGHQELREFLLGA
jgi:beta-phosphoglucomutase